MSQALPRVVEYGGGLGAMLGLGWTKVQRQREAAHVLVGSLGITVEKPPKGNCGSPGAFTIGENHSQSQ